LAPPAWDARECLRRGRHYRKPRTGLASGVGKIRDATHISARPFAPEDRSEFGHWEGDLVLGTRGTDALITLVERQSRYSCVVAVPTRTALSTTAELVRLVSILGAANVKSITWDNGKELSDHANLTRATGVPVYFCDRYAPWQRGTN
jgi:IS30 family transposase